VGGKRGNRGERSTCSKAEFPCRQSCTGVAAQTPHGAAAQGDEFSPASRRYAVSNSRAGTQDGRASGGGGSFCQGVGGLRCPDRCPTGEGARREGAGGDTGREAETEQELRTATKNSEQHNKESRHLAPRHRHEEVWSVDQERSIPELPRGQRLQHRRCPHPQCPRCTWPRPDSLPSPP
jgi:hypothetical protein